MTLVNGIKPIQTSACNCPGTPRIRANCQHPGTFALPPSRALPAWPAWMRTRASQGPNSLSFCLSVMWVLPQEKKQVDLLSCVNKLWEFPPFTLLSTNMEPTRGSLFKENRLPVPQNVMWTGGSPPNQTNFLGVPSPFFPIPGIILSKKPPKTLGKQLAFAKKRWLKRMGNPTPPPPTNPSPPTPPLEMRVTTASVPARLGRSALGPDLLDPPPGPPPRQKKKSETGLKNLPRPSSKAVRIRAPDFFYSLF